MTWQIAFVFVLLIAAIVLFVREEIAPELVALGLLVVIAVTGLVPVRERLSVGRATTARKLAMIG